MAVSSLASSMSKQLRQISKESTAQHMCISKCIFQNWFVTLHHTSVYLMLYWIQKFRKMQVNSLNNKSILYKLLWNFSLRHKKCTELTPVYFNCRLMKFCSFNTVSTNKHLCSRTIFENLWNSSLLPVRSDTVAAIFIACCSSALCQTVSQTGMF